MKRMIFTILKAMDIATKLQYRDDNFALITNWENPFTGGVHGDWRNQVRHALCNSRNHDKLASKLFSFGPFVLAYTKILEDKQYFLDLAGFSEATVCIISSSGEHLLTPWMIIHNVGHTAISWNIWIKNDIMDVIGLTSHDDSIIHMQGDLVDCASSRNGLIPNINELIYELFTTWVWFGETRSNHSGLCEYCNLTFPKLMDSYRCGFFWHKYRHPLPPMVKLPWLEEIVSNLDAVHYTPGVPGFTSKVLKAQDSSSSAG
jgi:hypothetical protein